MNEPASGVIFGYAFRHPELLEQALTTPACKMEHPECRDNQRLEFLGDAVLGFLAADRLYADAGQECEGELTVRRARIVSTAALCAVAERHGLSARLRRNRGAAPLPPHAKTYADAVEAILGAVWLDGGLEAARRVFAALDLGLGEPSPQVDNPKGTLQVVAQALTPPQHPEYALLKTTGKAHEPKFTVRVSVPGQGSATATAGTRREAEAEAAARLLSIML